MSTMDWYYKKLMRKRKHMGHKHTLPAAEISCTQSTDAQHAIKKLNDNIVYFSEQTTCPSCKNEIGNFVLMRSVSHQHHACGKCFIHYIIEADFLAPFSEEQNGHIDQQAKAKIKYVH